jgi:16S rRNA processing protein RimM
VEQADAQDLVAVARVVKTRGIRGEITADLLTDFPERFEGLESLIGVAPDGGRRSLRIEEHWFHGKRIVFKFAGYDSIDAAKVLVGSLLSVPEAERVQPPKDHYFDSELAGCRVETVGGQHVGSVREVMRAGGVDLLVVDSDGSDGGREAGRELLIPMAQDICVEIDVAGKLIRVDPPEGLLEL